MQATRLLKQILATALGAIFITPGSVADIGARGDATGPPISKKPRALLRSIPDVARDSAVVLTRPLAPTPALVISAKEKLVIRGVHIENPAGNCLEIRDSSRQITIENSTLGPCKGAAVKVSSSSRVIIRNNLLRDTGENGISLYDSNQVDILGNRIENTRTGVYALKCSRVNISTNQFLNVRGPMPRGQFVQFDKVAGPGNRIKCNVGVNEPGKSSPEDAINLYMTNGAADDPIQVVGNRIKGGGPSKSGGGIMLGDAGGSYQVASHNVLIDPGQYGIAVASGSHMVIANNRVYGRRQAFTNVGVSVWNQYASPCHGIAVENNIVDWTKSDGTPNPGWDAANCGSVRGWPKNTINQRLAVSVFDNELPVCRP